MGKNPTEARATFETWNKDRIARGFPAVVLAK
jgi:hypothetical protein